MEHQQVQSCPTSKQARVLTLFIQWEVVFHESNYEIPEERKAAVCLC